MYRLFKIISGFSVLLTSEENAVFKSEGRVRLITEYSTENWIQEADGNACEHRRSHP